MTSGTSKITKVKTQEEGWDWAYKAVVDGQIVGDEDFILATGDRLSTYGVIYGYQFTPATGGDPANSVLVNLGNHQVLNILSRCPDFLKEEVVKETSEIGDYVWIDADKDGIQDICEAGLPNATVELYDASCQLVGSTTTDSDGHYMFNHLNVDPTSQSGSSGFTGLSSECQLLYSGWKWSICEQ